MIITKITLDLLDFKMSCGGRDTLTILGNDG